MQGVITKKHVLAHPLLILDGFGPKVLLRALLCGANETFLDVLNRCAEEEAHRAMADFDLARTVERFIGFETRARDLYLSLSRSLASRRDAAEFFATISLHEDGHAIVLARVRREIRRGHLWKESAPQHVASVEAVDAQLTAFEREAAGGVTLARALDIADALESSEINVVFDNLRQAVDLRSRARFERFFVLTKEHLAFVREGLARLRASLAA